MNARGKSIDTTRLSIERALEYRWVHRDYMAHCLRWSHVLKALRVKNKFRTANILDVGCGGELPLAKTLWHNMMTHTTGSYMGVDYGKIEYYVPLLENPKFNCVIHEKTDYVQLKFKRKFDVICCFEVLEHVEPLHAFKMLQKMRGELELHSGTAYLSTPVYDAKVGAADNHVNEMSFEAFALLLELAGFTVNHVYGTFASQKDYKALMSDSQREVFDELSEFFDTNMMACIMAPMFPNASRNCFWEVSCGKMPTKATVAGQHVGRIMGNTQSSSSTQWKTDLKQILTLCR